MNRAIADAVYVIVATMWLIPDARVERFVDSTARTEESEVPSLSMEAGES